MIPPDINSKIQTLSDAHKHTLQLINRLAKLPAEPGALQDFEDTRAELGAEIHDHLKEQQADYELLAQDVEYQGSTSGWQSTGSEKARERAEVAAQVARIGENIKTARTQFRKAQLQAKRNIEAAKRKERELLFSGIEEEGETGNTTSASRRKRKEKENLTQDDLTLNASNDVTNALKRMHTELQANVQQSQFAHETLQQSTKQLEGLTETYTDLDSLLSSSRSLVRTLIHSNKSDTWYLETAFWILVVTISWLFFRRILYGPTWWLVYLPIKLFWRLSLSLLTLLSSALGIAGATKQNASLSQASESISTSLTIQPSAIGSMSKPTEEMPTLSTAIGGGGEAAKAQQISGEDGNDTSVSDEVGEMVEKSRNSNSQTEQAAEQTGSGTVLRERGTDEPPNPKKRMWEEPPSDQQQAHDEL